MSKRETAFKKLKTEIWTGIQNTADTGTTFPKYATKLRPRTPTIDEPHGVISIKYTIYSLKMDHRIRNM
jgi:hypothetical protein